MLANRTFHYTIVKVFAFVSLLKMAIYFYSCSILGPPSIELKEFIEAEEGTDINIVAKIKGVPFPTLTWFKAAPKKPDDKTPVLYDQHVNKVVSEDTCTLLIQQSRRRDTGLYTLTAVNNLGTASKEMRLNVLGKYQGLLYNCMC